MCRAHDWALRFQSAPGFGTNVRLWLPLVAAPSPGPAVTTRHRPGKRVLVVDDEDLVRGVFKAMLEHKGCEVLTAANGREGVDLLRREEGYVDAVLLDLNIPLLDG